MNSEQQTTLRCLRCNELMEFGGTGNFYRGDNRSLWDSFESLALFRCPACGKVEFFEFTDVPPEAITCLNCGETIPADRERCPACGWTWLESEP